jgi:hypothetical protein
MPSYCFQKICLESELNINLKIMDLLGNAFLIVSRHLMIRRRRSRVTRNPFRHVNADVTLGADAGLGGPHVVGARVAERDAARRSRHASARPF